MVIAYGTNENWRWDGAHEVVEFTVHDDDRPIVCRVSYECIDDNFGNPKGPEACLDAAKERFDPITDLAGALIKAGRFEPDGSSALGLPLHPPDRIRACPDQI